MREGVENPEGCCEIVTEGGTRGFYSHQCTKKPKVERGGKKYCTIHDPEYIKTKNEKDRKMREATYCKECEWMPGKYQLHYAYCPMCGKQRFNT